MTKNEYDMVGHINVPYNKKTKPLLFREGYNREVSLYKNGNLLDYTSRLPMGFIKKYLLPNGYEVKTTKRKTSIPRKKINGIQIGITKIKKGSRVVDLLISVYANDMRQLIKNCDSIIEYIEQQSGIKIDSESETWTRQEAC